jgi:hypothetical protein
MRSFILYLVFSVFVPCLVRGQNSYGIEANFMAGKVLKHTKKFSAPVPELSTAYELVFLKQTTGTQDWEQRRRFPLWGVGLSYTHYGIDSIYGNSIGLYPVLQVPLIRGKVFQWNLRAGLGIGYSTEHYERAPGWDTLNNAIGSHINNFTVFATDVHCRFNEHWSLLAGLNFSHLSNGAMKQPNLGVNMYGGHIGLRYWPDDDRAQRILRDRPKLPNRVLGQLRLGLAFNESGNTDGPIYPTYLASAFASKRYGGKNKLFIGLDYSYHSTIYAFQRNNEINVGAERAHSWKSAVFIGHEWLFGRMSLVTQIGFYIKEAVLRQEPYYQKVGYNYYLIQRERGGLKELYVSVLLKTHKSNAELVEYGIGIGF